MKEYLAKHPEIHVESLPAYAPEMKEPRRKRTGYLSAKQEYSFNFLTHAAERRGIRPSIGINPEELCHGNVKRSMKNVVLISKQDIRKKLDRHFSILRKRPDVLLGCFYHAGLAINQLW
jgi:hypothetical protein